MCVGILNQQLGQEARGLTVRLCIDGGLPMGGFLWSLGNQNLWLLVL